MVKGEEEANTGLALQQSLLAALRVVHHTFLAHTQHHTLCLFSPVLPLHKIQDFSDQISSQTCARMTKHHSDEGNSHARADSQC